VGQAFDFFISMQTDFCQNTGRAKLGDIQPLFVSTSPNFDGVEFCGLSFIERALPGHNCQHKKT
jgi:hypothetical protein